MSLNGGRVAGHRRMVVTLDTHRLQTLEQVREFLDGSQPIDLQVQTRAEAYAFVDQTVRRFDYILQGKTKRGCSDASWPRSQACRAPNSPGS